MTYYRHVALVLFLLALPFQTRWIIETITLFGGESQYGHLSLYLFDVLLLVYLALSAREWNKTRWKELSEKAPVRYAAACVAGLVSLAFVSIAWSVEPIAALAFALHLLGAGLLLMTLIFDREVKAQMILVPLAAGIIAPALLAWYQSIVQSVSESTLLGIAGQDPATPGVAVVEVEGRRWLRAYGSFPHPNILGGFAAISFVAALAAIAQYAKSTVVKMASSVTGGLAVILSASRASVAALLAGVATLYLCLYQSSYVTSFREMLKTLLLAALVMVAAGITIGPELLARTDTDAATEQRSMEERQGQMQEVREVITRSAATALVGVGGGNYTFALEEMRPLRDVWEYQPVHNVPLLIWSELGIVGLALILTLVICVSWGAFPRWESPTGASIVAFVIALVVLGSFDHYLWTQASGVYMAFAVFAAMQKLKEESL